MGIFRDRPSPQVDNVSGGNGSRAGRYGESYNLSPTGKEWVAADEGSYFTARNPTPGTGLATHAAPTTFDETKPTLVVYNGGQNRIYPQFLRLHILTASTGAVRVQYTLAVDQGNRYASGGSALTVQNVNMDNTFSSGATITAGAPVASAASGSRRVLDHVVFRGTIDVIEDSYELIFAGGDGAGMGGSRAATVQDFARLACPVVIGPGQSFLVHQWAGSQSVGPVVNFTLGFIER